MRCLDKEVKRQIREKEIRPDSQEAVEKKEKVEELENSLGETQLMIQHLINEKTRREDPQKFLEYQRKLAIRSRADKEEERKKKKEALEAISKLDFKQVQVKRTVGGYKNYVEKCKTKNDWVFQERGDHREFKDYKVTVEKSGEGRKVSSTRTPQDENNEAPATSRMRESTSGNFGSRRTTPRDMWLQEREDALYNETIIVTDRSMSRSRSRSPSETGERTKFNKERD